MKIKNIKIPIYDFTITILEVENSNDSEIIGKKLRKFGVDADEINEIEDNIKNNYINGGFAYRDFSMKQFCIMIYKCENTVWRRNVINHEKRHIVDRIMEWAHIKDIESPAYLDGYISKYMY